MSNDTKPITIITNHHPRPVIDAWELTEPERAEFDYLDWDAIKEGTDSASFVRYKSELYDLGEFMRAPEPLDNWDGYLSETFFSGIVVRWEFNFEYVVIGRYFT